MVETTSTRLCENNDMSCFLNGRIEVSPSIQRTEYDSNYTFVCKYCHRRYSSITGLNYHLKTFDHDNPPPNYDPHRISKRGRPRGYRPKSSYKKKSTEIDLTPKLDDYTSRSGRKVRARSNLNHEDFFKDDTVKNLTYAEAQRLVEFEQNNIYYRVDIDDQIEVVKEEPTSSDMSHFFPLKPSSVRKSELVPECIYEEKNVYEYCNPGRNKLIDETTYFHPMAEIGSLNEGCVEYELDEEDVSWLECVSKKRAASECESEKTKVSFEDFQYIMDRLEKDSEFIIKNTDGTEVTKFDEDVVCAVCLDGDCANHNLIVFCDICNMAVHQECYGLPYVPEGQWLCRRCSHAPSKEIECSICPLRTGVFKQTLNGGWCHIICALMMPGAKFVNYVFLEPIDTSDISSSRFNVKCRICNLSHGAVIQCLHPHCTVAYHASCAQNSGWLYLDKVEPSPNAASQMRYLHYCPRHICLYKKTVNPAVGSGDLESSKSYSIPPTIHVPVVSEELISKLSCRITSPNALEIVQLVKRYWQIKRYLRCGVPLLRRPSCIPKNPITNFKINNKNFSQLDDTTETVNKLESLKYNFQDCLHILNLVKHREALKLQLDQLDNCGLISQLKYKDFIHALVASINERKVLSFVLQSEMLHTLFQKNFTGEATSNYEQFKDLLVKVMEKVAQQMKLESYDYSQLINCTFDFISSAEPELCKRESPVRKRKSSLLKPIFDEGAAITPSNVDTTQLVNELLQDMPESSIDSSNISQQSLVWAHFGKLRFFPARVIDMQTEVAPLKKHADSREECGVVQCAFVKFFGRENALKWFNVQSINPLGVDIDTDRECLTKMLNSKSFDRNAKKNLVDAYKSAREYIEQNCSTLSSTSQPQNHTSELEI